MNTPAQTRQLLDTYQSESFIFLRDDLIPVLGYEGTAILSRLIYKFHYWTEKGQLQADGSFFYSIPDMQADLHIKEDKQRRCIKQLVKLGLLKSYAKVRKIDGKSRHFQLNLEAITAFLSTFTTEKTEPAQEDKSAEKPAQTQENQGTGKKQVPEPAKTGITKKIKKLKSHIIKTFNTSSSKETELTKKAEETPTYILAQHDRDMLSAYCEAMLRMSPSETIDVLNRCAEKGLKDITIETLEIAYGYFKNELQTKGRIFYPAKFFATGIERASTSVRHYKPETVKVSENAVPFYNWLEDQPESLARFKHYESDDIGLLTS